MKRTFVFLLAFTFLFGTLGSLGLTVSAAPVNTVLTATKDTYIQQGVETDYDNVAAPNYYGYNLKIESDTSPINTYTTFVEFNLSTITGSIKDATLLLNFTTVQTAPQTVQAYEVVTPYLWPNDATNNDNGMLSSNAPTVGNAIADGSVSVTAAGAFSINVSSYIQNQYNSGNKKITIALKVPTNTGKYLVFNSRESGANGPRLSVNSTTVPTVSMTAPYNNSYYNVGNTVNASANVKTTGTGVTISSVVFKLDDVEVAGTPTVAGSIYSLSIPNVTLGTHTIKAVATNSDGGVTTSAPVTINVLDSNTTFTKPTPKSATAGAYINNAQPSTNFGSSTTYALLVKNDATNSNDILSYLKFDLNDIADTIVNATVKLTCSGVQTAGQAPQVVQAYEINDDTWTSTGILPGNAPIMGSAISGATSTIGTSGDVGYFDVTSYVKDQIATGDKLISLAFFSNTAYSNYVAFDSRYAANVPKIILTTTKAPAVSITSPTDGDRYNPGSSVMLNATVTDADGAIASVEGYLDGNVITLTNAGNVYSATISDLAEGTHIFKIKAIDNLGAVTEKENTINVAQRSDPTVTWPTVSVINYGQTFADAIGGGVGDGVFTIEDATVVPNASVTPYTKVITFTPTDSVNYNTLTNSVDITVHNATQSAPAIEVTKTKTSITITAVEGAEYGLKLKGSPEDVVYGSNNTFTGLTSSTEYTAYIRLAAKTNYDASPAASLDATTDSDVAPAPAVTTNDVENFIVGLDLITMEYAISTDGGQSFNAYTSAQPAAFGGNKVVKVRVKAQGENPASADTVLIFTVNFGDINADGLINVSDVIMAAEIAVGYTGYTTEQITRANVSDKNDMTVDISDVVLLVERAAGSSTIFPVDL